MDLEHLPDVLGAPFTSLTLELGKDNEGDVVATLVCRPADRPSGRAVLQVHGFVDYFFHTEYAEWWTSRGYDFYALDLRKYGRSLRPHQTPHFTTDLQDYWVDLDAAWEVITRDHDTVIATAHSTGGLIVPLWIDDRQPEHLTGVVLNSPWFDLKGSPLLRSLPARVAFDQLGARAPRRIIPRTVTQVYGRSIHSEHDGEFDYDLDWKPLDSRPVYAGWLRAVRRAHADLQRGLDIEAPVLVLSSARSTAPTEVNEDAHTTDIVLDVKQIRRWASGLGTHVTSIAVDGAKHDVVLSRAPVRKRVYDEIDRWLTAYVDPCQPR